VLLKFFIRVEEERIRVQEELVRAPKPTKHNLKKPNSVVDHEMVELVSQHF